MGAEYRPSGCLLCPKHGNIPIDYKVLIMLSHSCTNFYLNFTSDASCRLNLCIFRMSDYCPNLYLHILEEYTVKKQQV